ncbi:hypothetical protein GKIL_0167 [Gloeobacter kilaueensis JS1]|uniref:Uncharacterized protein n=1 Tax=Gloeobacter kilaueensis (strain ATCC BAA-2537 / CCAP 1431/1 / ULC 316 / JS1) TaxID=1183438 RepID=U5QFP0_GLOK1|nr:hypothetical protein GKIL_0167 [Gloeobacter kilaueensis JS1]
MKFPALILVIVVLATGSAAWAQESGRATGSPQSNQILP